MSERTERYCNPIPNTLLIHRRLQVKDIPLSDKYMIHEKWILTQSARILMNDDTQQEYISLKTHISAYYGVEWLKYTFTLIKSTIRSRSLAGIKADHNKLCARLDVKIQQIKEKEHEEEKNMEEEKENQNVIKIDEVEKKCRKKKKRKRKSRSKSRKRSIDENINILDNNTVDRVIEQTNVLESDGYDFVFRLGNNSSRYRCRCYLSCFRRNGDCIQSMSLWKIIVILLLVLFVGGYIWMIRYLLNVADIVSHQFEHIQRLQESIEMQANMSVVEEKDEDGNEVSDSLYESMNIMKYCKELETKLNEDDLVLKAVFEALHCGQCYHGDSQETQNQEFEDNCTV